VHLFLQFHDDKKAEVKETIRSLTQTGTGVTITSALDQRQQGTKQSEYPNTLFCSFLLSAEGYRYLSSIFMGEFSEGFRGGMRGARSRLNDSLTDPWEPDYEHEFHAMVVLACDDLQKLGDAADYVLGTCCKDVIKVAHDE
jgi:hypothetical protein